MDIVKLVGAEDYSALRASPLGPPAQSRRRLTRLDGRIPLYGVSEPGLFYVGGSTRMAISKPNCLGTIFLKVVGATGLLGAARLALRVAGPKPPALNLAFGQVVEPGLFYVAGSTRMAYRSRIATEQFF
jgi:hypothetical protein